MSQTEVVLGAVPLPRLSRYSALLTTIWAPVALLVGLILVNSSVLLCGRTLLNIAPSDGLVPGQPYGYQGPELDHQSVVDQIGSFNDGYARDAYATHCFGRGVIPFWDPYQGLGEPFLVVGPSPTLYPINWLHSLLPPAWWDLVFLLQWLLGGLFLYAYLRILDIDRWAALVGALTLFACGTISAYLPVREAIWLPLLLYG